MVSTTRHCQLRYSNILMLVVQRTSMRFSDRCFHCAAVWSWNRLPPSLGDVGVTYRDTGLSASRLWPTETLYLALQVIFLLPYLVTDHGSNNKKTQCCWIRKPRSLEPQAVKCSSECNRLHSASHKSHECNSSLM